MLQDLHSHTYYSYCGKDRPEDIVEAAIAGGISLFGICDHANGVITRLPEFDDPTNEGAVAHYNRMLRRYFDHMTLIRDKYADRITVLRGIELATLPWGIPIPERADISYFDYALIEHIDCPESVIGGELFAYAEKWGCKCGVAHTDLFSFVKQRGEDPLAFFTGMAERGIFWEMNVNYDTIHGHRVHPYMLTFFDSEEQQEIIRRSGVEISIGFDGHRVEDYLPERVKDYCRRLEALGIPKPFSH